MVYLDQTSSITDAGIATLADFALDQRLVEAAK
jgi:hypothetical protein